MAIPKSFSFTKTSHIIAYGFGSGFSPIAPGTIGSLVAAVIWLLLPMEAVPKIYIAALLVLVFVMGVYMTQFAAEDAKEEDPGAIVWDEFVGIWITFACVPDTSAGVFLGFVFFRLFDIVKGGPVGWAQDEFKGGFGIMVDDVVASAFAIVLTYGAIVSWDLFSR